MSLIVLVFLQLFNPLLCSEPEDKKNALTVYVTDLRSDRGEVSLVLFKEKSGFPADPAKAIVKTSSSIEAQSAVLIIEGLPAGEYAFAIIHDENGNDQLDCNFIGIPKEGTCASNNAIGFMGPPEYEDAKFDWKMGEKTLNVKMRYL